MTAYLNYIVPPRTAFELMPEGTLCQIINNMLIMSPSPDLFHQDIASEIYDEIKFHSKNNNLGKVYFSPLDVYFDN